MSIFLVLAEPNRRAILDLLLVDDQPVGSIVESLDIGQPTVSKHLKVLRSAGLVTMRIDANRRIYSLQPQRLAEVDGWLLPYRRRWAARLDALEQLLDATDDDAEPDVVAEVVADTDGVAEPDLVLDPDPTRAGEL